MIPFIKFKYLLSIIFLGTFILWPKLAYSDDDPDIEAIEAELRRKDVSPPVEESKPSEVQTKEPITYSDLSHLAPFSEITVIQKKYLPKTQRFQLNLAGQYLTNNPFFQSFALNLRLGFFFKEFFGLELSHAKFNSSPRQATQDLLDFHKIQTSSLVSPDTYTGIDLVLVPFYGKMTWLDRVIVPYDMYFSLGGGSTKISNGQSASTLHLGLGQTLALSKSTMFRWDISGNNYTVPVAKVATTGSSNNPEMVNQNFTDLYLGIGFSFLFPGAKYR